MHRSSLQRPQDEHVEGAWQQIGNGWPRHGVE
jgi:hypothetical protein